MNGRYRLGRMAVEAYQYAFVVLKPAAALPQIAAVHLVEGRTARLGTLRPVKLPDRPGESGRSGTVRDGSDFRLFSDFKSIVDFDPEVMHGAFKLEMA